MPEEKHTIHIRIRDLRRANSLTQEELAAALGLSRQSINALEAGRTLPSLPVALQIAQFFSVPVHAIFAEHETPTSPTSNQSRKEQSMTPLVPFSPLREMREMLDEMMDSTMSWSAPVAAVSIPAVNLSQTDDAVHVDLRLPGFKREDLDIEVGEDFVTVSGEHKEEASSEAKQWIRREFAHQSFSRTVALPALVQTSGASAEMRHGVLHITLKKQVEEKPKTAKLEIKAE